MRQVVELLLRERGHHRITIDPAASNEAAIRCYSKAGFTPVGVMRLAERDADGRGWHDSLMMELVVEPRRLREELEGLTMARPHSAEVTPVERHDDRSVEPLRQCDHRRVGSAEREVRVLLDQLGDACEVLAVRSFDGKLGQAASERPLPRKRRDAADEVRRLRHHEGWYDQLQLRIRQRATEPA